MARYFFNIYDGVDIFDNTGTELRDANEVRLHMLALARAWIDQEAHQNKHWSMEARDESENIVGSMRFGIEPDNGA